MHKQDHFNRSLGLALCLAAAGLVAATAQAAPGAAEVEARFTAADVDHDGKLTLEEAKAGMPRLASRFDKIDSAKRGYVTLEQVLDFVSR